MPALLAGLVWGALGVGLSLLIWKAYLFISWNIERAIFFSGVQYYLRHDIKAGK